jgi:deoxyribodipyrimidine photo-lyase
VIVDGSGLRGALEELVRPCDAPILGDRPSNGVRTGMSERPAIVLFTRDLRVHDQPALAEAAATGRPLAPLFVLDDRLVDTSPNRLAFLLDALHDLRTSLRERGADLAVRRGEPVEETLRLAHELGAGAVYASSDVSGFAQAREERLARACEGAGVELQTRPSTTAVAPGALRPAGGDCYRVFTPYYRQWSRVPLGTAPTPRRLTATGGLTCGPIPALGTLTRRTPSPELPGGGETAGRERLTRWLSDGLADYGERGELLVPGASSRLSPYLHLGCLSAAEVVRRAREHQGAEPFVRQLCWRDFYHQLLAANPQTRTRDLRPRGDEWSRSEESFERWRDGRTGYPIVDAAMRQLRREGWMPNRARLVVGSFLTKTLYLDWRQGERHFFDLLVDGDVANNVGNWQWVAGTGADTRPNRVLNPELQARRFDPDGEYVRTHVPELAHIHGAAVHEPWKLCLGDTPPDYPERMVDHAEAAARFRARRG